MSIIIIIRSMRRMAFAKKSTSLFNSSDHFAVFSENFVSPRHKDSWLLRSRAHILFFTQNSTKSSHILDDSAYLDLAGINKIDQSFLEALARQHPTPLRLHDMYLYGASNNLEQRLRNAQFLYKELQIRIAHRVVDLLTLPHGLSEAPSIISVAHSYIQFLQMFTDCTPPTTSEYELSFTEMIQLIIMNRDTIPHAIAAGVVEWRSESISAQESDSEARMEEALYRFFTARVGLRFLAEHFVLSSQAESVKDLWKVISLLPHEEGSKMRGCIQPNVDIVCEIRKVVDLVKRQAGEYYQGLCPQIDVVDCVQQKYEFTHGQFTHIPHHIHYVFYELLKNSCRASIRRYHSQQQAKLQSPLNKLAVDPEIPPIRVIISMGEEDVTIKVADRGGGIPRSAMATIWKFAHSTASHDELNTAFGREGSTGAKLRGFGLPLARIYARYFGGELTLKSTEGYGLDAYLHIPRLGTHCENLPLSVRDSPSERDSMPDFSKTTR